MGTLTRDHQHTATRPATDRPAHHATSTSTAAPTSPATTDPTTTRHTDRPRDADGMAVAAFVLGLVGLLVFNLVFGPCAIALATLALLRGTHRKGRAFLGLTLGVADLVVLFSLLAANDTVTWQFGG
ncbi:DUF4190 domain-containing protein [Streptomyces buecherae]|uniref:DUF4190 domain-containing protein n=1 Tax=Streptomyces buecherae TaxID=2763006 RepID=UPI0020B8DF56|nr:DUF4190 domain-containing protein [Streptomyces buecherae]